MYQVLSQSESLDKPMIFFVSNSLEDCFQVALNLHRACNVKHRFSVFDTESSQTRLSLYSVDYG